MNSASLPGQSHEALLPPRQGEGWGGDGVKLAGTGYGIRPSYPHPPPSLPLEGGGGGGDACCIYSIPQRTAPTPSSRALLGLILALFALPMLIALGLYAMHWRPAAVASHGELVTPPRPLPANGLTSRDGHALGSAELRGRWLMVLAVPGPCDAGCLARIDETRRIQVALHRNMSRVGRLVLSDAPDPPLLAAAHAAPDLLLARPDGLWRELLADADAPHLYLVDPLGNLVMRYPPRPEPAGVKRDLERLLKFSWNG